jgi:hypothetical protein
MVCEHKYMNIRPPLNYRAGGATACNELDSHIITSMYMKSTIVSSL